jgi:hypothetical protein
MALNSNEQGQISIFFSASLVVLVSIIAFVINVGLFVKAKINLQNATDAAAYAGAAVQARQLSKIAHLNWEMRNIYKEWLYKYYVVGNLNIDGVKNANATSDAAMNFTMQADLNVLTNVRTEDPYNFPSVCIHLEGSETNICRRYAVPGLPEFGSSNLPGAEAASRSFQDALIATKIRDCVARSQLNMMVAATWAYNVIASDTADSFSGRGPAIMADRQGAWPRAIELAMRIRNLENIVNREPLGSICTNPGSVPGINCSRNINEITSQSFMGNERAVKAFYSGFRNIGGSYEQDEMKTSFTLTELPVGPFTEANADRASMLLIPPGKAAALKKYYLDLKLMTVNLATFYSAMIPRSEADTSGACDVTKAAIPVPGYPLGYYKNPDVLTYYAVKGEASFVGMFNPFSEDIKLTAFAAAKPMGGRIGPTLFYQPAGSTGIFTRDETDPVKRRSIPYIASLDIVGTKQRVPQGDTSGRVGNVSYVDGTAELGKFFPGMPLPVNGVASTARFWLDAPNRPVGGRISEASGVQFGIPNLVYDYKRPGSFTNEGYAADTSVKLNIIKTSPGSVTNATGLFSQSQFAKFRGTLGPTMSIADMENGVARVRAPTAYEAANYLIPTPFEQTSRSPVNLGHFGQIPGQVSRDFGGVKRYDSYIYAPLYGSEQQDLLYSGLAEVTGTIYAFMVAQQTGMRKYITAMNEAARAIYKQADLMSSSASGSRQGYVDAAKGVSDIADFDGDLTGQNPESCASLAGIFLHFYYGPPGPLPTGFGNIPRAGTRTDANGQTVSVACPTTLSLLIQTYFSAGGADPRFRADRYLMEYSWHPPSFQSEIPSGLGIYSAYVPGGFTGAGFDGTFTNLSVISEMMRRNFYSTKLIAIKSLVNGGSYTEATHNFYITSEGSVNKGTQVKQGTFVNSLQASEVLPDH